MLAVMPLPLVFFRIAILDIVLHDWCRRQREQANRARIRNDFSGLVAVGLPSKVTATPRQEAIKWRSRLGMAFVLHLRARHRERLLATVSDS